MLSSTVKVINGPNLAGLGVRQPEIYGTVTQDELVLRMSERAGDLGVTVDFMQSDIEGELVSEINRASGNALGLIINPAAYSHYSVAIMDAMKAFKGPVAEVHISQVFSREGFRSNLVTAAAADVFLAGAGIMGYLHALDLIVMLSQRDSEV